MYVMHKVTLANILGISSYENHSKNQFRSEIFELLHENNFFWDLHIHANYSDLDPL